jgi:hypothetical protein
MTFRRPIRFGQWGESRGKHGDFLGGKRSAKIAQPSVRSAVRLESMLVPEICLAGQTMFEPVLPCFNGRAFAVRGEIARAHNS